MQTKLYFFLSLFAKVKNNPVSTHSQIPGFINNFRSKQNKKVPNTLLQALVRPKRVQNFSKKVLNSMVVTARQRFPFFREITWFLGNKLALSKFKYWILHPLISIIKLQNNQSLKPNFILTTRATHLKGTNGFGENPSSKEKAT